MNNNIIGFIGRKGSGKSFFVKELLKSGALKRYIIIDTQNEYSYFGTIIEDVESLREFLLRHGDTDFRVVFKLKHLEDQEELFWITRNVNNYTLIVEEIHLFCNPYFIQEDLKNNLALGRHKGRSLWYISQRPAQINKLLTSQSDLIVVVGAIHEPADLAYFGRMKFSKNLENLSQYEKSFYGDSSLIGETNKKETPKINPEEKEIETEEIEEKEKAI